MRAVDGSIVVVCAVEGVMPQTETVVRQSLKEKVKPILFVNKVDRLINELKVTPEQMQERFVKILQEVNSLIRKMVPDEFKDDWIIKVEDGSVAFGSAYYNWAISAPYMAKSNISFRDIYDYCKNQDQKTLAKKAPIHEVLLDMTITHMPNPIMAQKYRIPHIWHGDLESDTAKSMINCNSKGPVSLMVTKILLDPHAGEIAVGRLFSGKLERGMELKVVGMPKKNRVQQVAMSVGADRITVDHLDAGNIAAVSGLKDAIAGSTVTSDDEMNAFERIVHYSEPVVTVAIEAKHMKDLPKLVEVLRSVAKADPSIQVEINQETGEHLLSGMGELHLEITQYRIVNEHGIDIVASEPIVVYRENIEKPAGPFEGKSPNKHNKFYLEVEPLDPAILKAIKSGEISQVDGKIKDSKALARQLQDLGMSKGEAKGVKLIHNQAFQEAMNLGPLAQEKCLGMKVRLVDAKLHEDSIHRGPAQIIPAVRSAIYGAMCLGERILMEPKQTVFVSVPQDQMGNATREVQQRRAVIEDMKQEEDMATVVAKTPVSEMFGFASAIRSATAGRALWTTEHAGYERVPRELQTEVVKGIRTRKGLKPEPYDAHYYAA
jgi:elongation factor 2